MRKLIIFFAIASALCACSSIDCPLNNKVYAQYKFAGDGMSDGTIITVTTSLSQAEGDDSVLINKMEYADSISLPMSYARTEDVFYFKFEKRLQKRIYPISNRWTAILHSFIQLQV